MIKQTDCEKPLLVDDICLQFRLLEVNADLMSICVGTGDRQERLMELQRDLIRPGHQAKTRSEIEVPIQADEELGNDSTVDPVRPGKMDQD